LNYEVFHNDG